MLRYAPDHGTFGTLIKKHAEQAKQHLRQFWHHLIRCEFNQATQAWREYRNFKIMEKAFKTHLKG